AGGQQDGLRLQHDGVALGGLDDDLAGLAQAGGAVDEGDLVLLEQEGDAVGQALDDGVLAGEQRLEVQRHVRDPDAGAADGAAGGKEWRESSRALLGMQPMLRQVPPRAARLSTQATRSPSWAARMAATYPPGPAPITTRSNTSAIARLPSPAPGPPARRGPG